MINKFFLLGIGGVTVASAGAGIGIYYANQNKDVPTKPQNPGQVAKSPKPPIPQTSVPTPAAPPGPAG